MKTLSSLALALVLAFPTQAQVIFQSGFENWTGNQPDGWFGAKTNIASSNVAQVDVNPHSGGFAVRLQNTSGTHQRFTTQPLTVVAGESYEITFWLRGSGEVRTGLFDGRSTLSGYFYNPYTMATADWTLITQQMTAVMDTTLAEFILSVRNTVETDHLVIDDVNISLVTVEPPMELTIQEIQETQAPDGGSAYLGETVSTGGVVTANLANGFFIQNGGGPWSGIFVFSTQQTPARGDEVSFTATVEEFFGMTQLTQVNDFVLVGGGNALVVTDVPTAAVNTESYEAVLVKVSAATCTNPDAGFGQFAVNDGSGVCLVDDVIYQYSAQLNAIYDVTGPVQYAFNEYKVLPRDADDVDLVTAISDVPAIIGALVYPNPATDNVVLEVPGIQGRTEYTIIDASGRILLGNVLAQDRSVVDLSDLANGMYVLTLRSGASIWSTRLAVQR